MGREQDFAGRPANPIPVATAERLAGFELTGNPTPISRLLAETWAARRILAILARKDFYVRYRRASFGMMWAVGLPVIQSAVMAAVFSRVLRFQGVSYPIFVFSGLLPWTFVSTALVTGSTAIVDNAAMSNKIYFPRAVLPLVTVLSALYSFLISLVVLLAFCGVFRVEVGPQFLLVVPATLLATFLCAAFTTLLAAMHVYFRDIRYLVQAAVTAWFYLTPVLYPLRYPPRALRPFIIANPVTGIIELFRVATVGADRAWPVAALWTGIWTVGLVIVALVLHRRFDRVFADLM
jgi:ABC-type polysaccharide/polyol phosphate export permease